MAGGINYSNAETGNEQCYIAVTVFVPLNRP